MTVTLDDYRRRHAHTRLDPDLQALHLRHPMVVRLGRPRHGRQRLARTGPRPTTTTSTARGRTGWPRRRAPARSGCRAGCATRPTRSTCTARSGSATSSSWSCSTPASPAVTSSPATRAPSRSTTRTAGSSPRRRWSGPRSASPTGRRPGRWSPARCRWRRLQLPIPPGSLVDAAMPSGYRVIDGNAGVHRRLGRLPGAARPPGRGPSSVGRAVRWWCPATCTPTGPRSSSTRRVSGRSRPTSSPPRSAPRPWGSSCRPGGAPWPRGWPRASTDYVWSDLEHHGYLRVDVRPDELRGDWIAAEPGDGPAAADGHRLAGRCGPELPVVLRPSTPSSSLTALRRRAPPRPPARRPARARSPARARTASRSALTAARAPRSRARRFRRGARRAGPPPASARAAAAERR